MAESTLGRLLARLHRRARTVLARLPIAEVSWALRRSTGSTALVVAGAAAVPRWPSGRRTAPFRAAQDPGALCGLHGRGGVR